jgi:hypothetical protein
MQVTRSMHDIFHARQTQCSTTLLLSSFKWHSRGAGLPDAIFSNQQSNLGKFWRALELKMLFYFMVMWNIYGHWVYFIAITR